MESPHSEARAVPRSELLAQLYEARSKNYPDLGRLKTSQSLEERRGKVVKMLATQRVGSDRWKKLSIEKEFIRIKLILCFKDSPPSVEIILDKARIELLDSTGQYDSLEERMVTKREVSLILLKYTMLRKTDDELAALVQSLQES